MKNYHLFIALLFLSATLSASEAYDGLDSDQDGYLSLDEAQSNPELASRWDTLDVNGDGQIDEAEFAQFEVIGQEGREGIDEIPGISDMPP